MPASQVPELVANVTSEVTFGVRYVLHDPNQAGAELVLRLKRTDTNTFPVSERFTANTTWPAPPADFIASFAVSPADIVAGVQYVISARIIPTLSYVMSIEFLLRRKQCALLEIRLLGFIGLDAPLLCISVRTV